MSEHSLPQSPYKRWGRTFENVTVGLTFVPVVSAAAYAGKLSFAIMAAGRLDAIPVPVLAAVLFAAVWVKTTSFLYRLIKRRWLVDYVIDTSAPNVVKLHGSFTLVDAELVARRLRSIRPDYMTLDRDESRLLYQCDMAAVPASQSYLNARRELKQMGLDC